MKSISFARRPKLLCGKSSTHNVVERPLILVQRSLGLMNRSSTALLESESSLSIIQSPLRFQMGAGLSKTRNIST